MRIRPPVVAAALALLTGCSGGGDPGAAGSSDGSSPTEAGVQVEVVTDGFDHAWDVAQASDGTLLVDQRAGGLTAVLPDGTVQEVSADFGDLYAQGETGLMGLVL